MSRWSPLWRHRDFRRLWAAESVSQLGSQVTLLAFPLIAISVLHATTFEVGALTAIEMAPFVLVGLFAGVWVDRLRRRPILIVGDLGRALVLATIPLAAVLHHLTLVHLYVASLLTGVLTVFFDVAYQSYLPSLVDRAHLADGNGKLEISRSGAQVAGPGVAGPLIQAITAPYAVAVDATSFVVSALFVARIRRPEPPIEPPPDGVHPKMRSQIAEGFGFVWRHPLLRPIALCTATSNLFSSMVQAVFVVYLVRSLHLSAATIGLVFGVANAGFVVGAIAAPAIARRIGIGRTIVLSIGLASPFALLYPLAPAAAPLPFLMAGGLLVAVGSPIYNITQVSLRQAITPDRLLGRMNASMRFLVWGTLPLGALVGGVLGSWVGLRAALVVGAAGSTLAFLPPLFSPVWGQREVPDPDDGGGSGLTAAPALPAPGAQPAV